MTEVFETDNPEATVALGRELAGRLHPGDCVAIVGDLGAGKTVLVRGLALGLGLADARDVSSPTYVLVQEYAGRVPIFHVDLYRLTAPQVELAELGIEEMLAEGVVLIEWADRAGPALPRPRWQIEITVTEPDHRRLDVRRLR